ncbi:hypothetical protein BGZ49_010138 [Haplosporangium sp. Z 27]|nr:hypothetical protein BGZ49_010138 [Haplosporangium sp. Z 27]
MTRFPTLLAIVAGAVLQIAVHGAPVTSKGTCNTPVCQKAAADILSAMEPTADPCLDFSQFTCGAFFKRPIPDDSPQLDYFSILQDELEDLILEMATPGNPKFDNGDVVNKRNIRKIQDYYSSCMNDAQNTKIGRQPLLNDIQALMQDFYVENSDLDTFNSTKITPSNVSQKQALSSFIGHSIGKGIDTLVLAYVFLYNLDPTKHIVIINKASLGMPAYEYGDANKTASYYTFMSEMFSLVLGNQESNGSSVHVPEIWANVSKGILEFESALAQISNEADAAIDPTKANDLHTIAELDKRSPSLDWNVIFQNALPSGVKIPENFTTSTPDYLNKLDALLNQTSPKTIQNYFAWNLIRANGPRLSLPYSKPSLDYRSARLHTPGTLSRKKTCLRNINTYLPHLVGYYFVKDLFNADIGDRIHEIVESIRSTYVQSFDNYSWLDPSTKEEAVSKMKAIAENIGYSRDNPDEGSLASIDEFYSDLVIDPLDYYGSENRAVAFLVESSFRLLGRPVNKKQLIISPQTVNAYYLANANTINILAGFLQAPLFELNLPEYVTYGGMGSILGHEMTHGFDNNGRNYDATGLLRNWWSNSSIEAFQNRTQCFIDEYSNFTFAGPGGEHIPVNGQVTLPENIADNGGVKKSFETWLARYKSDPSGLK